MTLQQKGLILAIETTQMGGSVALFSGNKEIGGFIGENANLKSENVLSWVWMLLKKHSINKNHLGLIIVSRGPGSTTGIRTGLAMAKGLSDALGIPYESVSLIDAIRIDLRDCQFKWLLMLKTGKGQVCMQRMQDFDGRDLKNQINNINTLDKCRSEIETFLKNGGNKIVTTENLIIDLSKLVDNDQSRLKLLHSNLANYLGRMKFEREL